MVNFDELAKQCRSYNVGNSDYSKNVSCKVIKLNEDEKEYTLQCNPNDDDILDLNGAFSELGNENLIVNFLDSDN